MPTYDYSCSACHFTLEVIHGIYEPGPRFCPNCGVEGTMRKGFNTPAVHFKGTGWAKKDRSATASSGKAGNSKAASTSEGGEAGSSANAGPSQDTGSSPDTGPSTSGSTAVKAEPAAAKPASGGGE